MSTSQSEPDAPLVPGDVFGWRVWRVVEQWPGRYILHSVWGNGRSCVWPPDDWLRAVCTRKDHTRPTMGCSCGIYVASTLDQLHALGYTRFDTPDMPVVAGRAQIAGRTVECTLGYHAEKARPAELWVPYHHPWIVRPLRDLYRIPVHLANTRPKRRKR